MQKNENNVFILVPRDSTYSVELESVAEIEELPTPAQSLVEAYDLLNPDAQKVVDRFAVGSLPTPPSYSEGRGHPSDSAWDAVNDGFECSDDYVTTEHESDRVEHALGRLVTKVFGPHAQFIAGTVKHNQQDVITKQPIKKSNVVDMTEKRAQQIKAQRHLG